MPIRLPYRNIGRKLVRILDILFLHQWIMHTSIYILQIEQKRTQIDENETNPFSSVWKDDDPPALIHTYMHNFERILSVNPKIIEPKRKHYHSASSKT